MSRLLRAMVWTVVGGFLLLLFLPLLAPVFVLAFTLAAGWIGFLRRVLPELTWNPAAIGMFVLCSVVALAGIQSFGRWLRGDAGWRWKWTLSLYAGLWLLFLTVMGATGVVHQVGWLVASKESWFGMRGSAKFAGTIAQTEMKSAASYVAAAGTAERWQWDAMQANFWASRGARWTGSKPFAEKFQAVFLPGARAKVAAVIILPRSRDLQNRAGLALVTPDSTKPQSSGRFEPELLPIGDLPRLLQQYGGITNSPATLP